MSSLFFGRDASRRADCRWLHARLGYYLEGALGHRAMQRANHHLDLCPGCQRAASLLESSLAAARGLRSVAPGADFEEAVWEKIRISREIQRQPSPWRAALFSQRFAWWGGGALAVGASALGLVLLLGTEPHLAGVGNDTSQLSMSTESATPSSPGSASDLLEPVSATPSMPSLVPVSVPQAGDETAPPAGGARMMAQAPATGRLEPGAQGSELYFEDVQLVPDPSQPERGYYPVRQAVMARPGEGRISF